MLTRLIRRKARRSPQLVVTLAVLLLALACWELLATLAAARSAPSDGQWREISEALRKQHRTRHLVVFAPRWIDPIGRLHVGDLISLDTAGRMDAAPYATLWELAMGDARAPETRGLTADWTTRAGNLVLRRYRRKPRQVVSDLEKHLRTARVVGRPAGRPGAALRSVAFEPRRCIRVVLRDRDPVTLRFPALPLGKELVVYAGLVDEFPRLRHPSELASLSVALNRTPRARMTVGQAGWKRLSIATSAGKKGEVAITIQARGPIKAHRRVCIAGQARK